MGKIVTKIKSSKIVNSGVIKKVKDKIYFKFINPKEEKKTDKYRVEIIEKFGKICDGCHWQLLSGALLRYHRDNTMDGQDLDFFLLRDDFEKIKNKFFEEGFKIHQLFIDEQKRIDEYRFDYKGCEVDVFLVDKEKKGHTHRFTMERPNAKKYKKEVKGNTQIITGKDIVSYERKLHYFDKSTDYEYKTTSFKGPKMIEESIFDIYGKNWTFYDPTYDPRTCPENNMPIEHENATSLVFIKALTSYDDIYKDIKN